MSARYPGQAGKLNQVIFAGYTHDSAEKVAGQLLKLAPRGLDQVFFSDSGSTSVEVALKMALGYWRNIGEQRTRIVMMQHSYHGDTIGAMSVGARGVFNAAYGPLLFEVISIPFPARDREQATLDELERACRNERPATFIVEPLILGAGGMLMYPAWMLKKMKQICEASDVLFIADEVMTGWGRTGTLFACEQAEVTPDIARYSKGLTGGALPLAVTLCRAEIFDAYYSKDRTRTFFHSSSYTANPVACAAQRPISISGRIRKLTSAWPRSPPCKNRQSSIPRRSAFCKRPPDRNHHSARSQNKRLSRGHRSEASGIFQGPKSVTAPARQYDLCDTALMRYGSRS
ncbi:adenosylmethionine-8-amino-7-oxononanoate aminotransferase [Bradyrhizobium sp. USDA 3311]